MRSTRAVTLTAVLLAAAAPAAAQVFNGGMPAGYTCAGTCGTSGADGVVTLAPLGGTQFGWISTVNGPTQDPLGVSGTTNGTLLTSPSFTAAAGQALSFRFNYVTSDGGPFDDYAFVRLLGGSGGPLVLFTARTIPSGNTVPGQDLPGIAAGVTLAPASTPVIPGAPAFTPLGASSLTCYDVGCGYTGWVRASYTIPLAGSYQLEFGVMNLLDELWDSSLAMDYTVGAGGTPEIDPEDGEPSVTPEPSTWLLVASGLGAVAAATRRRRRAA